MSGGSDQPGRTTSRHLEALRDAVRAGAHVVLHGHLHDEVLYDGEIADERWAIGEILRDDGRYDAVVCADGAQGLRCADPNTTEMVSRVLAAAEGEPDARGQVLQPSLEAREGHEIARAALALVRQQDVAVAVVLDDLDLLIDPQQELGRAGIAQLRLAVREAACRLDDGIVARRNVLVVLDAGSSAAAAALAALPGVRQLDAEPPDRPQRARVLSRLARGFYSADGAPTATATDGFDVLADITHGWSIREHEQLRRVSHQARVPPSRPASLVAKMPGYADGNLIARVGFARIRTALEESIVGQPHAVGRLLDALAAAEHPSALRPHGATASRPLMTALMFGPTGVGKTEVARTLGRALFGSERALLRIDCAELKSSHDLARLTGAPPGYVGHEAGGALSGPLRRRPGSIVLFDEFEKAHPALGELLLGVLDDGRLTDGRGETVRFGEAIVLLTTNIGASELTRLRAAGATTEEMLERGEQIVEQRVKHLVPDPDTGELVGLNRPELWSRLQDSVVGFDVLRKDALEALTRKYCDQIARNLDDELDLRIELRSETFVPPIAARLDPDEQWDGRTIAHHVRQLVERPLRELRLGDRTAGERVTIVAGADGRASLAREADWRAA
jgi:hypothetical protein